MNEPRLYRALEALPGLHAADAADAWQQVLTRSPICSALHFSLGGLKLRLEVVGEALARRLFSALRHREIAAPAHSDLNLHVWDARAAGLPFPSLAMQRLHEENEQGLLRHLSDSRHLALRDSWLGLRAAIDDHKGAAWIAYDDDALIPEFEHTAPLRNVLQLLMSSRGWHLMHAAMIGKGERALLLAGAGGSGKSTTACTALLAGWGYGADDLCLFNETSTAVESLYQTVKLREGGLARLDEMRGLLHEYDECEERKAYLFVSQQWPERVLRNAQVSALLVPVVVDADASSLAPLDWRQGLAAVLPWTRRTVRTCGPRSQVALMAALRRYPVYSLRLGRHRDSVLATLDQALQLTP
ncbi:MAG: hypothetical protein V4650_02230 [Pseudomonadota bacterium]